MASDSRRQANRSNAARSTGPRTANGKRRSAQNSRRHGLSTPVLADPHHVKEFDTLAKLIAGEGASAKLLALARTIAEAQLDLVRIKFAKREVLLQQFSRSSDKRDRLNRRQKRFMHKFMLTSMPPDMAELMVRPLLKNDPEDQREERLALMASTLTRKMAALERYERRARSRRKFAIRAFDKARHEQVELASGAAVVFV